MKTIRYTLLIIILMPITVFCQLDPSGKPKFNPNRVPFTIDITCEGSIVNLDDTLKKYTSIQTLRFRNVKDIVRTSSSVFKNSHVNSIDFYGCSKKSISKVLTAYSIKKTIEVLWIEGIYWGALPKELAFFDKIGVLILKRCGKLDIGGLAKLKAIGDLSIHDSTEIGGFPKSYNPHFTMDSLDVILDSKNGLPRNTEKIPRLKYIGIGIYNGSSSALTKAIVVASKCRNLEVFRIFSELRELPENIGKLQVKSLSFIMNRLKSLPASIANIQTLESIELRGNEFETFPEVLLSMPSLTYVDISSNSIHSFLNAVLPVNQLRESNIESLYLENNQLPSFPLEILELPKLRYVNLSHNKFPLIPDTIRNAARCKIRFD